MKEDVKNKWVEALRSGKYKQGKRCLRNENDEFCCLGVLCDLYDPNLWGKDNGNEKYRYDNHPYRFSFPPTKVLQWSDMPKYTNDLNISVSLLIDMNDHQNKTFNEIADFLENGSPNDITKND